MRLVSLNRWCSNLLQPSPFCRQILPKSTASKACPSCPNCFHPKVYHPNRQLRLPTFGPTNQPLDSRPPLRTPTADVVLLSALEEGPQTAHVPTEHREGLLPRRQCVAAAGELGLGDAALLLVASVRERCRKLPSRVPESLQLWGYMWK